MHARVRQGPLMLGRDGESYILLAVSSSPPPGCSPPAPLSAAFNPPHATHLPPYDERDHASVIAARGGMLKIRLCKGDRLGRGGGSTPITKPPLCGSVSSREDVPAPPRGPEM